IQRFAETYYYGQKRAGGAKPPTPFREELARDGIAYCTRDDVLTDEARELLELNECYAGCLVALPNVRGSIWLSRDQPPGWDETAIKIIQGIARQTATLVEKSRLFDKTTRAAKVRAGLAALAAAVNLEKDPDRIASMLASEAARLFRATAAAMLIPDQDAIRIRGAHGFSGDGLRIPLHDESS